MEADRVHRKKCKRYNVPGHVHELTFSCYHGRAFLKNPVACRFLAEAIGVYSMKFGFELWAYVFMPEHVHLLIYPTQPDYSISKILQGIKLSVSRKMINYLKKHKPETLRYLETSRKDRKCMFWQDGGGYDRNIFSMKVCKNAVDYIHANPVRRGLVLKASEWYYSSYKDWKAIGNGPVNLNVKSFTGGWNTSVTKST